MLKGCSFALGCALLLATSHALADAPSIRDEVRTVDGGVYRGTIVENVPNGEVVLLLPTGETRRFERPSVRYAGAIASGAEPAPAADAAPSTVASPADGAMVVAHFEASEPSTLYTEDSWATVQTRFGGEATGYGRKCTSPCSLQLPRGAQHVAIARQNDDSPRPVEDVVTVDRPSKLSADWHDRHGARLAGILTLSIGLPIGLGMTIVGFDLGYLDSTCNTPVCYGAPREVALLGATLTAASLIAGLVLVTRRDFATIEVTPLSLPPAPGAGGETSTAMADLRAPRVAANGAAIRVRF